MSNLLNNPVVLRSEQDIKHDELVAFALEAFRYSASNRNLLSVACCAPVDQIARRVNPGAEFEVAHQDLVGQSKQSKRVSNCLRSYIDRQPLVEALEHRGIRQSKLLNQSPKRRARHQRLARRFGT